MHRSSTIISFLLYFNRAPAPLHQPWCRLHQKQSAPGLHGARLLVQEEHQGLVGVGWRCSSWCQRCNCGGVERCNCGGVVRCNCAAVKT